MKDLFVLSSPALPPAHRVIGFRGLELLSRPYEFGIDLLIGRDLEFDMETALGERITLTADRGDDRGPMQWHGVVADLELVHELAEAGIYSLTLVPALWQLSLSHHSRIFVDETTPTIIAAVLKENGIETSDYELRLSATYKKLEHVCQYEETDLAFISRWMEREGIYYFFEQGEEREKLIVTDDKAHHQELVDGSVRYVPQAGGGFTAGEALHAIVVKHARLPSKVKLQDYDYNRPDLAVVGDATVAPRGTGEVRMYGENFTTPDEGKRLATVRAQALSARKRVFHANGTAMHLRPGYTFELDEHPRPAFNTKYLVTALEHVGNQAAHAMGVQDLLGYENDRVYGCKLAAITASAQFRPERATPTPRVDGAISAVIDGPADSPYAQIDKQGRYKIRVQFDEGEPTDGKGSMYVRMLQPHGGANEGFHFPLRKGTEVMLLFLGGDPDQPIIAGVVPNAHKPSVVTGENHTKNVINTGGQNRLELEDADGRQHVRLATPTEDTHIHMGAPVGGRHLLMSTTGNSLLRTTGNSLVQTTGDLVMKTIGAMTEAVDGAAQHTFAETREETTKGFYHQEIQAGFLQNVTGFYEQNVKSGGYKQTVDGYWYQQANAGAERWVTGDLKEKITGNVTQSVDGDFTQEIKNNGKLLTFGNVHDITYGFSNKAFLGESASLQVGASKSMFVGARDDTLVGLTSSGSLSVSLSYGVVVNSSAETFRTSAKLSVSQYEACISSSKLSKVSGGTEMTTFDIAVRKTPVGIWESDLITIK